MRSCQIDLHNAPFLVELLLEESYFGCNTQTQMHTSTYPEFVFQNCIDPDNVFLQNLIIMENYEVP